VKRVCVLVVPVTGEKKSAKAARCGRKGGGGVERSEVEVEILQLPSPVWAQPQCALDPGPNRITGLRLGRRDGSDGRSKLAKRGCGSNGRDVGNFDATVGQPARPIEENLLSDQKAKSPSKGAEPSDPCLMLHQCRTAERIGSETSRTNGTAGAKRTSNGIDECGGSTLAQSLDVRLGAHHPLGANLQLIAGLSATHGTIQTGRIRIQQGDRNRKSPEPQTGTRNGRAACNIGAGITPPVADVPPT
jgi:hypothetical protein